ncbi:hypothetical protein COO60DRAFT_1487922 [Scenedesmus sp. NREL 46B-D3]|nr:hypothetical protein COO60DRAFT_1487922 [Scenedesmus sp. NREL 46B-D3]
MNRSPAGKRATVDAAVAAAANPCKPNLCFSGLYNADGISIAAISRERLARVSEVYVGCCDAATYTCAYGGATMGMHASVLSIQPHPGGLIRYAEPILSTPILLAKVRGIGCLDWVCLEILRHGSNPIERNKGKLQQCKDASAAHLSCTLLLLRRTHVLHGTSRRSLFTSLLLNQCARHQVAPGTPMPQPICSSTHTSFARTPAVCRRNPHSCAPRPPAPPVPRSHYADVQGHSPAELLCNKQAHPHHQQRTAGRPHRQELLQAGRTDRGHRTGQALLRGADSLCKPPAPAESQQTSAAYEPEDSLNPALAMDSMFANIDQITAAEAAAKARAATTTPATTAPAEPPGTSATTGTYLAPADSKPPFNAGRGSSSAMRGRGSARGGIHSNRQAPAAEAASGAGKGNKQHGGRASSSSRQPAAAAATPAAANQDSEATAGEAAVHQHRGRARSRSEREAEAAAQAPTDGNGAVGGEE